MKVKHTPGPWIIGNDACGDPLTVWGADGKSVTCMFDAKMGSDCPSLRRAKANAVLIAAAPDMLDMLDTIKNDDGAIPGWLWDRICEVRARAGGRQIP